MEDESLVVMLLLCKAKIKRKG